MFIERDPFVFLTWSTYTFFEMCFKSLWNFLCGLKQNKICCANMLYPTRYAVNKL